MIESHEKEREKVSANKEIYTAIANGSWRKEDKLRSLKGQAAELDRKIALTISDNKEEKEEERDISNNEISTSMKSSTTHTQEKEEDNHYQSIRPRWRH